MSVKGDAQKIRIVLDSSRLKKIKGERDAII